MIHREAWSKEAEGVMAEFQRLFEMFDRGQIDADEFKARARRYFSEGKVELPQQRGLLTKINGNLTMTEEWLDHNRAFVENARNLQHEFNSMSDEWYERTDMSLSAHDLGLTPKQFLAAIKIVIGNQDQLWWDEPGDSLWHVESSAYTYDTEEEWNQAVRLGYEYGLQARNRLSQMMAELPEGPADAQP